MCLSVPAKVVYLDNSGPMPMGEIDVSGERRPCCFAYRPEAQVGDYVLVQNSFAMSILAPEDAAESFAAISEFDLLPSASKEQHGG